MRELGRRAAGADEAAEDGLVGDVGAEQGAERARSAEIWIGRERRLARAQREARDAEPAHPDLREGRCGAEHREHQCGNRASRRTHAPILEAIGAVLPSIAAPWGSQRTLELTAPPPHERCEGFQTHSLGLERRCEGGAWLPITRGMGSAPASPWLGSLSPC